MAATFERLASIFRAKVDQAIEKHEDPSELLEYSFTKQLEVLKKVRRMVTELSASRKRVEAQASQLSLTIDKLGHSAERASANGKPELVAEALARQERLEQELAKLQASHTEFLEEEERLEHCSGRLQAKVDAFRARKDEIKAAFSGAEARARITTLFAGITEEMGDAGIAVRRAERKIASLVDHAEVVDGLLASRLPDEAPASGDVDGELDAMASEVDAEDELARVKTQLAAEGRANTVGAGREGRA